MPITRRTAVSPSKAKNAAIHGASSSTTRVILISYGLVGALFGLLLFVIFGRAPLASIAYLGPVMLYSVTHVGVRFSEFWIFLALVYAQARFGTWGAPTVALSSDPARW